MAWEYRIGVQQSYAHMSAEQINNATEFYNYFGSLGATLESICGMLGNIEVESGLNPGNKQTASTSSGWGLIQWTPSTVLTDWCSHGRRLNWYDGAAQCYRIQCEGTGTDGASGYWLPVQDYPYTWAQFCELTDVELACKAYLYERERAGVAALDRRITYANDWYAYFTGQPTPPTPQPPVPPTPYKRETGLPVYMMVRNNQSRIYRKE